MLEELARHGNGKKTTIHCAMKVKLEESKASKVKH